MEELLSFLWHDMAASSTRIKNTLNERTMLLFRFLFLKLNAFKAKLCCFWWWVNKWLLMEKSKEEDQDDDDVGLMVVCYMFSCSGMVVLTKKKK